MKSPGTASVTENSLTISFGEGGDWPSPNALLSDLHTHKMATHSRAIGRAAQRLIDLEIAHTAKMLLSQGPSTKLDREEPTTRLLLAARSQVFHFLHRIIVCIRHPPIEPLTQRCKRLVILRPFRQISCLERILLQVE